MVVKPTKFFLEHQNLEALPPKDIERCNKQLDSPIIKHEQFTIYSQQPQQWMVQQSPLTN